MKAAKTSESRAKRGRPQRSPVAYFQASAWFNSVALEFNDWSPYRLQKRFQRQQIKNLGEKPTSDGAWDKYRDGTRTPKAGWDKNGFPHIAQLVGEMRPITLLILQHPLWMAMEANVLNFSDLETSAREVPTHVARYYKDIVAPLTGFEYFDLLEQSDDSYRIWVDYNDWQSAFHHLGLHAVLLRIEVIRRSPLALKELVGNLGKILGPVSISPWVSAFYEKLYDWLEQNLWGDLFDRFYDRGPASARGWRKTIPYWLIDDEDELHLSASE